MNDKNLDQKIELLYKDLENRSGLSRKELEYRGLQLINWHLDKAEKGEKVGVLSRGENGKQYFCRPDLDLVEKIYQRR